MLMTNWEIYISYKTAKLQQKQVKILSQLNGVPRQEIMDIVRKVERDIAAEDKKYREAYKKAKGSIPVQIGHSKSASAVITNTL